MCKRTNYHTEMNYIQQAKNKYNEPNPVSHTNDIENSLVIKRVACYRVEFAFESSTTKPV